MEVNPYAAPLSRINDVAFDGLGLGLEARGFPHDESIVIDD